MRNKTLTEIGIHHGTDKAIFHGFTDIYDKYFTPLRDNKLTILEIGIDKGYSIFTLRDYFTDAQIYAVDCLDKSYLNQDNKFILSIGDQADREYMQNLFPGIEFDIIIDDGGHGMDQQQVTLEEMLPRLKSKGIYILEDLHTSYEYGYSDDTTDNTTLNLIENIKTRSIKNNKFYINNLSSIQKQISTCNIYYNNTTSDNIHRGKSITSVLIKK
jgi:hypothetical protein